MIAQTVHLSISNILWGKNDCLFPDDASFAVLHVVHLIKYDPSRLAQKLGTPAWDFMEFMIVYRYPVSSADTATNPKYLTGKSWISESQWS